MLFYDRWGAGILFRNKVCTEWWSYEPRNRTIHWHPREAHLFQFIPTIWQSSNRIPGQRQTLKSRNGIVATDSPFPVSSSSSSSPAVENKKTWGWLEAATTLAISFPSKLVLAAAAAAIAFNFNEKRIFKYRGSTRRLAATRANRGAPLFPPRNFLSFADAVKPFGLMNFKAGRGNARSPASSWKINLKRGTDGLVGKSCLVKFSFFEWRERGKESGKRGFEERWLGKCLWVCLMKGVGEKKGEGDGKGRWVSLWIWLKIIRYKVEEEGIKGGRKWMGI